MALFSLLVAIIIERLKLLPGALQLDNGLHWYQKHLFAGNLLHSLPGMLLALLLPAVSVAVLLWVVNGWFFGLPTLMVWVVFGMVCFSHQRQRAVFKRYMQAACRGDVEACYLYAGELDCTDCVDAVSEKELGARVGQMAAWINYRYYAAVALFLIVFGPVGVVFYCTVRFFAEERKRHDADWPLLPGLLYVLDWLPARLVALGFVFSGQFSSGFSRWRELAFDWRCKPRSIITGVAVAAEVMPEATLAPICVRSTIALLALSKRNFVLLLTILSLLTIFGWVR
ncbi:beta-lactamase regulator AmpE [Shewanella yunxiaonensis]|uniref:Beta-lactamase regulator AmpE n=1 Tax=Shewanella yunxiaonensis TaxID=2829809 RepID=A0ABX7YUX7_9GAMM|nr:beta-lactamase regulator AmpE [Shewanella yunxiaonensis]QUN06155.1 beta-lactamase regulator AmpE [Shewanella yunxiaonensis]